MAKINSITSMSLCELGATVRVERNSVTEAPYFISIVVSIIVLVIRARFFFVNCSNVVIFPSFSIRYT